MCACGCVSDVCMEIHLSGDLCACLLACLLVLCCCGVVLACVLVGKLTFEPNTFSTNEHDDGVHGRLPLRCGAVPDPCTQHDPGRQVRLLSVYVREIVWFVLLLSLRKFDFQARCARTTTLSFPRTTLSFYRCDCVECRSITFV